MTATQQDHPPEQPHPSGQAHGHSHGHGHSHAHAHGPAAPVSGRLRKVIAAVLIPFAVAVVAGLVALWPGGPEHTTHGRSGLGFDQETVAGRVVKVAEINCADANAQPQAPTEPGQQGAAPAPGGATGGGSGGKTICERATIEVTSGKDKGRTFPEIVQPNASRKFSAGQELKLAYAPKAPKNLQYSVSDVDRSFPMALLAGVFALVVVAVGRLRGVFALVALAISFGVLTLFILPAILQGSNPLVVAVVGGSAIMLLALYMCHGLSARTSVAVLGTLVSLLLIGVLGSLFIGWASLTGNTDDQTGLVHGLYPDIEIKGLLLAGVIIGSLGVLDDVTVTQTSAVWELREADPSTSRRKLYAAAMRIGRDHIASVVNTLVLAYAGASLPLLLLFSIADSGVGTVATSEIVAQEIVRTLVGSIGLVASVPVTTALAVLVVSADHTPDGNVPSGGGASSGGASGGGRGRGRRRRARAR
ncbi:putative membrane protein [Streptomyces himastatinicus ATCC 53653]|uniref:Putative membrane protein n=1 Tax=Streptomyces himastatinicus ATCC 53653 TaxID=457427 RepID=D9W8P3_9ACTN|nr:YibE/F family protein [Streptomyces himastatinicus]EFL24731.1 putative membrane protein [Streptomyces himastatinicus ATCC 53653]